MFSCAPSVGSGLAAHTLTQSVNSYCQLQQQHHPTTYNIIIIKCREQLQPTASFQLGFTTASAWDSQQLSKSESVRIEIETGVFYIYEKYEVIRELYEQVIDKIFPDDYDVALGFCLQRS